MPSMLNPHLPVLVCIVRDEIETLPRLFKSLEGVVQGAVIVDTGSVDGTVQWVRDFGSAFLSNKDVFVSVTVAQREWVNFAVARNQALDVARRQYPGAWYLLADADWEFFGTLPELPQVKSGEHYSIVANVTGHAVEVSHPVLILGDTWEWNGAVHEGLYTNRTNASVKTEKFYFHHHADSGARKYRDDENILRDEIVNCPENARAYYYLGQTLFDKGQYMPAAEYYMARTGMGGYEEEAWHAMYMVGRCHQLSGMYATAIVWYLKAIDRRNRPEPYYYLSQCLRHVGAYRVAERLLAYCDATYSDDQLFTAQWIEEWGIEFERAISLQRLGQYTSAREIYYRLMDRGDLPDEFRRVAVRNVTLMTDAVVN